MTERLPKNCSPLLENLVKSISEDSQLGVDIDITLGGKNRFQLKANFCSPLKMYYYYLTIGHNIITIPGIMNLFNSIYPDFLLKKTTFMPLSRLTCEFKLDKEMLAREIMKRIREKFKEALKYNREEGVSIYLSTSSYVTWSESNTKALTPKFKSFSEFLIWSDLNVK